MNVYVVVRWDENDCFPQCVYAKESAAKKKAKEIGGRVDRVIFHA